jgi:outer membrane protein insertion porin family
MSRTCALMLICFTAQLVGGPAAVWAQDAAKVAEVVVTGNQNINSETIRNAITLKPGDDYTEQAVEKDKAAIMSLGYFVAVTDRVDQVQGGMKITYEVTENPKLTSIKILGSEPVPAEKILELMRTKPGQVLSITALNQDIEAIQAFYQEQGYFAYVTSDAGVDPQTGVLTIPILVHTVESIEITGAKKTRQYVFLREMKTKPGSVFNSKILREDMARIFNLDILEDIKPYQINPGTEMGQVKILIPVVEKKTGQVSVGIGYSSKQRLVGQARLSETNFRGRAQGLNLLWEQGTTDAVGGRASYEIGFFEPWLDRHHTSLSVSAFNKILYRFSSGVFGSGEIDNQIYNERHKGGDLTLSRPISDSIRLFVGGRFENVATDPDLLSLTGNLYQIAQDGDVASGSIRAVRNTRDFELDPAAGGYDALALEIGTVDAVRFTQNTVTTPVLDDQGNPVLDPDTGAPETITTTTFPEIPFNGGFRKGSLDVRRYFSKGGRKTSPQDKRTTLAVRLRVGIAGGKLPFFEQFFVGGAESLRGYREDRFWGSKMLLASAELRKPIAQSISGVVFIDYGDAWDAPPEFSNLQIGGLSQSSGFAGNLGYGVGMRVATPIGNIRLDYGIGSEGGRTHFSMGQAF